MAKQKTPGARNCERHGHLVVRGDSTIIDPETGKVIEVNGEPVTSTKRDAPEKQDKLESQKGESNA